MSTQAVLPFDTTAGMRFMLAGCAIMTAESERTGTHFTFRVRRAAKPEGKADQPRLWFVSLLTGPDNQTDYSYLGLIRPPMGRQDGPLAYEHGARSRVSRSSPGAVAVAWVVGNLLRNHPTPQCRVHHEGRCGRCGRPLTVPESILSGYGPECIQHV